MTHNDMIEGDIWIFFSFIEKSGFVTGRHKAAMN